MGLGGGEKNNLRNFDPPLSVLGVLRGIMNPEEGREELICSSVCYLLGLNFTV